MWPRMTDYLRANGKRVAFLSTPGEGDAAFPRRDHFCAVSEGSVDAWTFDVGNGQLGNCAFVAVSTIRLREVRTKTAAFCG